MPVLPEYDLSGKVAILATSGGDEAPQLAQALAEAGATVFAVARRESSLESILASLGGDPHAGVLSEISTPEALRRAMAAFDRRHSHADILVNDARSMFAKPFVQITGAEWDELQSRNLRATFLLCQEVGGRMVERGYGRIVNLISVLAERGMINGSAFSVSQAGLLALTRSLAVEWGRQNVRVNALGSGWSIGEDEDIPLEEQRQELLVRYTPLRRKGRPADIAPLLVFLCSDSCDYNTGQPIYVDGGLNAHP